MSLISRRPFSTKVDLRNPQQAAKFLLDLSLTLDDIVAAINGLFVSQNNVAASRTIRTVYQNTTGKLMLVVVSVTSTAVSQFIAYSDSSATPATVVATEGQGTIGAPTTLSFLVLPGNYYQVTSSAGAPTVANWTEWS